MNARDSFDLLQGLSHLLGVGGDADTPSHATSEWVTHLATFDGHVLSVAMRFEASAESETLGMVSVVVTETDTSWYNERGFPPRRLPRTTELKLVVTSNMEVRGPMQAWEAELLTPLVREFVLGIVEQRGKLSVVPDKMASGTEAQNVADKREAGHGAEED